MSSIGIWIDWKSLNQTLIGKKIIFFGRGEWVDKTLPHIEKQSEKYIVDNNAYEQNTVQHGLNVLHPETLTQESKDSIFILITTTGFDEVIIQLEQMGFIGGVHFCVAPALNNFKTLHSINNHRQQILVSSGDNFIDSETEGGGLYLYDIYAKECGKVINGLCHGLVKGDDAFYLVDDTVGGIRVLDANDLKQMDVIKLPDTARPHGIAYSPQRKWVFVAFSGRDSIGVFDTNSLLMVKEIRFSTKIDKLKLSQHHINDLCVYNDYLYVSMFSFSGNWKQGVFDGGIYEMDIDSGEKLGPVIQNMWMPHSVMNIYGNLHWLDSMRGDFYKTSWKVISHFNGFIRGLAYDGQFYYVGQSLQRYMDRLLGFSNNIPLDTGFFLFDENSKASKFFPMLFLNNIHTLCIR